MNINKNNYFEIDYKSKNLKRSRKSSEYKDFNFIISWSENEIIKKLKNFKYELNFILEIGCQGNLGNLINKSFNLKNLLTTDISFSRLKFNKRHKFQLILEDYCLPFNESSFSGLVSCLYIDNSANSKGFFSDVYKILNNKGFFIISLFGSNTLNNLKESFIKVEEKKYKGISLRFHPLFELQTIGNQLKDIGFKNVIVETENFKIQYNSVLKLMHDLRGMGLTNSLKNRSKYFTPRTIFQEVQNDFSSGKNKTLFLAQFEIITITAWKN